MKRKVFNRIFLAAFLLMCLIPAVGMLVFGPSKASANEILASKPKLVKRDGSLNESVLSDTADYVSDRFYLRREFITLWSGINTRLFSTSPDDSVLQGKSDFLYYTETLEDFTGSSLENGKLLSAARNLALMQEYVNSCGGDFLFTVAPNKNSLYPEYMPSAYENGHENANAVRLEQLLSAAGVSYADLFSAIGAENRLLYYRTDSHWNSEGAALGADTLLSALGRESGYYAGSFTAGEEHLGDLYEMLYPTGTKTETDSVPVSAFTYETASNPNGGEAMTIETTCAEGSGTLTCWRDSFGNALYPYLAQSFEKATFLRASTYDLTKIGESDTVIIELVERNIARLVQNEARFPAPKRNVEPQTCREYVLLTAEQSADEELMRVTVRLPAELYDFGGSVYFSVNGNCCEACVLYPEDSDSALAGAWIDESEITELRVICPCSGILTEYISE